MIEYSFKQLEELELAYAITIHKSQGSEYPAVILPMYPGPRMLMTRNLIYTIDIRIEPEAVSAWSASRRSFIPWRPTARSRSAIPA